MTKIKEMPELERPIERLINYGVEALSNEELLAIILKTGTKDKSVKELSLEILKDYDINNLKEMTFENIQKIKGIGKAKAATLIATFELASRMNSKIQSLNNVKINTASKVFDYFNTKLKDKKQEYFYCLYLNSNKKVIKNKLLFLGTLNYSTVHPREIFKEAYLVNATSIICVHNHPTGNITPSKNDIDLTDSLIKAGVLLGIKVDDHIIIGNNNYYSFFENNLI